MCNSVHAKQRTCATSYMCNIIHAWLTATANYPSRSPPPLPCGVERHNLLPVVCVGHAPPCPTTCRQVSVWDVDSGTELISLTAAMESHPLFCSFSPDAGKLAVTESNGNVLVWNVQAGCQVCFRVLGFQGNPKALKP